MSLHNKYVKMNKVNLKYAIMTKKFCFANIECLLAYGAAKILQLNNNIEER